MCRQLKLLAQDDKIRLTDVATSKQLLTLIKIIPSDKKEEFHQWLTTNELQQLNINESLVQTLLYTGK